MVRVAAVLQVLFPGEQRQHVLQQVMTETVNIEPHDTTMYELFVISYECYEHELDAYHRDTPQVH